MAINELIPAVNIVPAVQPTPAPGFASADGAVDIAHLVAGVNKAPGGCGID